MSHIHLHGASRASIVFRENQEDICHSCDSIKTNMHLTNLPNFEFDFQHSNVCFEFSIAGTTRLRLD